MASGTYGRGRNHVAAIKAFHYPVYGDDKLLPHNLLARIAVWYTNLFAADADNHVHTDNFVTAHPLLSALANKITCVNPG